MRNPLRKRYLRELKKEFGKYLVIFLFQVMLITLVSGYLVAATSVERTFYKGFERYNAEDGHITFSSEPSQEMMDEIAGRNALTFYDLSYAEEDIEGNGATLRIYRDRKEVNTPCLMDGELPVAENEIVLDRTFAMNNKLRIGDRIVLNNREYTITGIIALVDYGCLFENLSDMVFDAIGFGVALVSDSGFDYLESAHVYSNYAWKYDVAPEGKAEEHDRSEAILSDLEEVITEYDLTIAQVQEDEIYDRVEAVTATLESELGNVSAIIEEKLSQAIEDAFRAAMEMLSDEEKMMLHAYGEQLEIYLQAAAEKCGVTVEEFVAQQIGTTADALQQLEDTLKEQCPDWNFGGCDTDFSLDGIRPFVKILKATGLYDTTVIENCLDELEGFKEYEFDDSLFLTVKGYAPRYENKAITYCMDDMTTDRPMFVLFDYIVVIILAFIFAVTTINTVTREAGVIGTLRATGFSKGQMVRHYLIMTVLVSLFAAVVGNVLGYTVGVNYMKGIFYKSFSLATYENYFSAEAFILTTVIPVVLMIIINLLVLNNKMQLTPMQFLRRDLTRKKRRRAMLLNKKIPFMVRFRLRVLFQNIPAYLTMFVGIFFAGVIAVFGTMFVPLLDDYAVLIRENRICDYQYVLMEEKETATAGAEKYSISSLNTMVEGYLVDEVSIYGVEPDSKYITKEIPAGQVLVSNGMAEKFKISAGDVLSLKDPYNGRVYEFSVAGDYTYEAALSVFMNREEMNRTFGEDADHFSGYFSDAEIRDIDRDDIVTVITEADLVKVSEQMKKSMGGFVSLFRYFGVAMFLLMMYLLTKQILEKNMQSIAMTKILGFKDGEIAGLYLVSTGIVVLLSLGISIPLIDRILRLIFSEFLYTELNGYLPFIVSPMCYIRVVIMGVASFLAVCGLMMVKIGKIKKSEALKNVE